MRAAYEQAPRTAEDTLEFHSEVSQQARRSPESEGLAFRAQTPARGPGGWRKGRSEEKPCPEDRKPPHLAVVEMAAEGHVSDELGVVHQICQKAERREGTRKGTVAGVFTRAEG